MTREEFEKVQYAKDIDGNMIHVDDVVKDRTYYCQFCGEAVLARRGRVRVHHFYHKNKTPNCNYETYLHKLAKEKISQWLQEQESILFHLWYPCSKSKECVYAEKSRAEGNKCIKYDTTPIDIKKYFHFVGIEQPVDSFIADILMTDNKTGRKSLLIEISVCHPNSTEKINSGLRIIEFNIESEEDIDAIVHDNNIFEGKGNKVYGFNLKSIPDTTPKCFLNLDGLTVQFQKLVQQTGERCMFCTHFAYIPHWGHGMCRKYEQAITIAEYVSPETLAKNCEYFQLTKAVGQMKRALQHFPRQK